MRYGEQLGMARHERVAMLIQEEVAALLTTEIKDPRIGLATVTHVELTRDLSQAVVRVSIYGPEQAQQDSLAGLTAASGFIRHELGRRLQLRHVPTLHFQLDDSTAYGVRMDRVLRAVAAGAGEGALDALVDPELAPVDHPRLMTPAGGTPPAPRRAGPARRSAARQRRASGRNARRGAGRGRRG